MRWTFIRLWKKHGKRIKELGSLVVVCCCLLTVFLLNRQIAHENSEYASVIKDAEVYQYDTVAQHMADYVNYIGN